MHDIKDFDTFYSLKLQPVLAEMTETKRAQNNWQKLGIIMSTFGIIYAIVSIVVYNEYWPVSFIVIIWIFFLHQHFTLAEKFKDDFNRKILVSIINYIQPDLYYHPEKFLSESLYRESRLWREPFDHLDGQNFFNGQYRGVPFICSQIKTSQRAVRNFTGLLFMARLTPDKHGGTFIWSKTNRGEKQTLRAAKFARTHNAEVTDMQMDHPVFNDHFSVCTTSIAFAKQHITAERMNQMVKYKTRINPEVSFSFVNGKCYVALPLSGNMFNTGEQFADKVVIKQHFMRILLLFSFIDKLSLQKML